MGPPGPCDNASSGTSLMLDLDESTRTCWPARRCRRRSTRVGREAPGTRKDEHGLTTGDGIRDPRNRLGTGIAAGEGPPARFEIVSHGERMERGVTWVWRHPAMGMAGPSAPSKTRPRSPGRVRLGLGRRLATPAPHRRRRRGRGFLLEDSQRPERLEVVDKQLYAAESAS